MIIKYNKFLNEDYFKKFGGDKVNVDIDDYSEERDGLNPGDVYNGFVSYEDYYCESCPDDNGNEDIEVEITVERSCDDLDIIISSESKMDKKSSGTIVLKRIEKDDEDIIGEYCPSEIINTFIIYDDGKTAWDWSFGVNMYFEVILYIYYFFDLDSEVYNKFIDYYDNVIEDEDEILDFKEKYNKELLLKKQLDFNI